MNRNKIIHQKQKAGKILKKMQKLFLKFFLGNNRKEVHQAYSSNHNSKF